MVLAWGHHLTSTYEVVGGYFLAISVGILATVRPAYWLMNRYGNRGALTIGCAAGSVALLYLAAVGPPAPPVARMAGLLLLGGATGVVHAAIFRAISPMYQHHPAATVNLGGTMFGLGCLTSTLIVYGAYYVYTVPSILILLAVIPAYLSIFFYRSSFAALPGDAHPPVRKVFEDLRSPSAMFLALLLFFQFGNEWSIAGWLPLFLVQRLGISPETSLLLLGLYWICLLGGRIVSQALLPRVSHPWLLLGAVVASGFGCLILSLTSNAFGASIGILLVGGAFAPIYPLVVEKVGDRFPGYHPGFYNGIFSFAFMGGLLAPSSIGWLTDLMDIRAVMIVPQFGTVMVLLLLLAIWVESRLPPHRSSRDAEPAGPS